MIVSISKVTIAEILWFNKDSKIVNTIIALQWVQNCKQGLKRHIQAIEDNKQCLNLNKTNDVYDLSSLAMSSFYIHLHKMPIWVTYLICFANDGLNSPKQDMKYYSCIINPIFRYQKQILSPWYCLQIK